MTTTGVRADNRLARWAVRSAAAAGGVIALSAATLGVAYAFGGDDAFSDNWLGFLVMVSLFVGSLTAAAAFAMAVTATARHQAHAMLWLPLSVFPASVAFVVIGELVWWE